MKSSRVNNSIKNSITALGSQLLITILSFINRSIFIRVLGSEYLGINGLFTNILSMLSLSEMGIGTAIVYNMYKAVNSDDQVQINALMSFYAKVYSAIGSIIMIAGIGCSLIIQNLIKDNPFEINFLRVAFLLTVFNNAVSYFWSYRSCILFANQKDWICKASSMIVLSVGCIVQVILLAIFKNYLLYLTIQIVISIFNNGVQFYLAKRCYPEVRVSIHNHLPKDTLKDIIFRVKSLILHSISAALNFGTDNIIISKYVGIVETGFYSNYSMLINTFNTFVIQLMNGVVASMGNLIVSENSDKVYTVFKRIDFFCHWAYGLLAVGMLSVIDQFITLWTGYGHLLSKSTVFILIVNFYVLGSRQSVVLTRNAAGLYTKDRIVAVIKPFINLFFSLLLVRVMGITGVFIGTLVSQLVADLLLFPIYLFKSMFVGKTLFYYLTYFKHVIVAVLSGFISINIIEIASNYSQGITFFLFSSFTSVLIYNFVFFAVFNKTDEFNYYLKLSKGILLKKK